jgi:hypothetical protein
VQNLPTSRRTSDTSVIFIDPAAYVCVQAVNSAGASACTSRPIVMPDFRDAVDAMFFSRGQYRDRSNSIPERDVWNGFPANTSVVVRLSSTLGAEPVAAVRRLVDQINQVLPGIYQISVEEPGIPLENDVLSGRMPQGQVLVVQVPANVVVSTCNGEATVLACAPILRTTPTSSVFFSGAALLGPTIDDRVVQHEAGHVLLGLAHVFLSPQPIDDFSWWEDLVMGTTPLTVVGTKVDHFSSLEVEMLRAVYEAGLRPGSSRNDFLARGLVQ